MPEGDEGADRLRREFLRQAPEFDLGTSLPDKVSALVRRRQRLRVALVVAAAAVVVAAVAIPLSALRSEPPNHKITPATVPTSTTTTRPTALSLPPYSCGGLDMVNTPAHSAVTTTAVSGPVSATLTGTTTTPPFGSGPALSGPVLSVTLGGGSHFSEAVVPPAQATEVIPWTISPGPDKVTSTPAGASSGTLCLANFPGEPLPTVLLGLDTGGAHCCTVVRAFSLSSAGLAPAVDDQIGNPGAVLAPDGNFADIVTADNAFAYAFASYAASGMPIKVLQFSRGAFVDVTGQHLDLVTQDASTWWTVFNGPNSGNGLGVLAAWVADECTLGASAGAFATLDQLQTQGKLTGPAGWPVGSAYVQALKSFLAQHRYCS